MMNGGALDTSVFSFDSTTMLATIYSNDNSKATYYSLILTALFNNGLVVGNQA